MRRSAPYVPTGVAYKDLVLFISDGGIASCVKARTGKIVWQERVGGNFFGSPILVGNRLFCISTWEHSIRPGPG